MKNLFSTIILALFLTVTIKSQTQVFEDKTDSYVFSSEVQKKFDRFKSKEEIKRWEAGKLKTEISFTKGMIGSLKIFENEFEFEIKEESAKKFNGIVGYWGDIKEGGIILIIGKDREYDFRIWHGECLYRIEWLGDGIHLIEEIDRAVFAKNECKLEGPSNVKSEKINSNNSITSIKTTEPIKIFVAYTPAVAPDINYLIEYCELVTKSSFENSSISSDIEIVGSQQLAYTESTDASTDLNRFVSINDGYLDEIHSLRNEYQADVCVLIVDSLLGVNGLAASIGAEYSTAFFVVNASATLEDLSFSHELGHLLGCRHDNDIGTLPYGNARGYNWYGKLLEYSNNLKKYKTIMSIKEGSDLRVPFFSNPYVNDDGSNPIGTQQYNYAAYAIDDYSSTIAAFQPRYTTSGTELSPVLWTRGKASILIKII